jgi:endonuclease III
MDRRRLIARTMRKYQPFTVGKKDQYSTGDQSLFRGWARNWKGQFSAPEDEDLDAALAAKAEAFLRSNPLAVLFAAQLDRGKPAWKAWRGPSLVAADLGWKQMHAKKFADLTTPQLAAVLRRCRLGCRNLGEKRASSNLRTLAKIVIEDYGGHADRIWMTATSFSQLRDRMYSLPGIGLGVGNMMIKFFVEFGMVPQIPKTNEALSTLQLKPDTHVVHVFYRAGLMPVYTQSAAVKAAAELAPDLPASLDTAGFMIGWEYCHKDRDPDCYECPIGFKSDGQRLCPRRRV